MFRVCGKNVFNVLVGGLVLCVNTWGYLLRTYSLIIKMSKNVTISPIYSVFPHSGFTHRYLINDLCYKIGFTHYPQSLLLLNQKEGSR